MSVQISLALLVLSILIPFGAFFIMNKKPGKAGRFKLALAGNTMTFFGVLLFATIFLFSGTANAAEAGEISSSGLAFIGAALSVGLGSLGAGIATGNAASAALGALSENEGVFGKAIIFVALGEGIAIYGLIIAFMILNKVA
ncbi:hypothetical protein FACS189490_06620 [Clostridia bacterium]|nr:hypothetical protein FACS189490_06620 [Clostridia bacterium]